MSDLAEIRRELSAIRDSTVRTERDVKWIKDGMVSGNSRMNDHAERISKIENGAHRTTGFAAGIAAVFGAAAGIVGAKLGWPR